MISLITMGQGNPIALQRTIDSVMGICEEVIFGDVCMFNDDTIAISETKRDIWFTQVLMPFDFIFKHGFSKTLNTLAGYAKNDLCIYLNVGEVIASSIAPIREIINDEYNAYYIDHETEKHRWWRVWDRRNIAWDGRIHEELTGDFRPYHEPLFRFADTDKDTIDPLRATAMNDIKEIVYFEQLIKIADDESLLGATNNGWREYAKTQYDSMKERLAAKGNRYIAFQQGNKQKYLNDIISNPEFEKQRFESSMLIEYQGDKKYLI